MVSLRAQGASVQCDSPDHGLSHAITAGTVKMLKNVEIKIEAETRTGATA
jgi:hypothetical protein|tara:strand:+ start:3727 stop:3876 length:150 start_codon:yes stop_codon:yes gene_type:complete